MPKQNKNKQHNNNRDQTMVIPQSVRPPPFNANIGVFNVRRRFICQSAAVSAIISAASLIQSYGLTCTTTNSLAVPAFLSARLKSVQVWGMPAATPGTASPATIVWNYQNSAGAANYSVNREVTDISTSTAYTPYVHARPPKGSQASFWNNYVDAAGARRTNLADTLFSVSAAAGSIVDVVCDLVMPDAGHLQARTAVIIAAGVSQAFACLPLDGYGGILHAQGVDSFT